MAALYTYILVSPKKYVRLRLLNDACKTCRENNYIKLKTQYRCKSCAYKIIKTCREKNIEKTREKGREQYYRHHEQRKEAARKYQSKKYKTTKQGD